MFNNLSRREKIMVITALFILIVIGYYYYIYIPLTGTIENLKTERNKKEKELELLIHKARQLPEVRAEHQSYLDKKQKLEKARMNVADILQEFNQLTADKNIQIIDFNPERKEKEIHFNIKLRGDYRQLSELLIAINSPRNRLEFNDLQIQAEQNSEIVITDLFIIHYWE